MFHDKKTFSTTRPFDSFHISEDNNLTCNDPYNHSRTYLSSKTELHYWGNKQHIICEFVNNWHYIHNQILHLSNW